MEGRQSLGIKYNCQKILVHPISKPDLGNIHHETNLSDLKTLFSDDLQVRRNPLSSPTTPKAVIMPSSKVMTWDE
jgi:arsenate reductase-like glutaredoxin family protein